MTAVTKKNIQTKLDIPSGLSDRQKAELAARILEEIRERTARGLGADGKFFQGYTKEYKESLDFAAAGKTSKVNLSSTGDMLAELDILNIGFSSITVGYELGDSLSGQVQGNTTGEYGNRSPVTKGRNFIGLPTSVINRLAEEIKTDPEFEEIREEGESLASSILSRFLI